MLHTPTDTRAGDAAWRAFDPHRSEGLTLLRLAVEHGHLSLDEAEVHLCADPFPDLETVKALLTSEAQAAHRRERFQVVRGGGERAPQESLLLDSLYDSPPKVSRPANHFLQDPLSEPTDKQRTRAARIYERLPVEQWLEVTRYLQNVTGQALFSDKD